VHAITQGALHHDRGAGQRAHRSALSKIIARSKVELLILDELAYVPLAPAETELVFQVLDQRSELSALIISTNLPFGEWTKVSPEQRLCKAVVDRLTFNAHIVETGTDSWRFKKTVERRQRKGVRRKAS
jgi:DNA replication protein DnaC